MQQIARTTDVLPAFVLLPHQFEMWVSQHADFAPACQWGFEWFCEDRGNFEDISTFREVKAFILYELCRRYNSAEVYVGVFSLPFRVGCCLGWLSAFAFIRRDLALQGLAFLSSLVISQYQEEVQRGFNPLVALPGAHSLCR